MLLVEVVEEIFDRAGQRLGKKDVDSDLFSDDPLSSILEIKNLEVENEVLDRAAGSLVCQGVD